MTEERVPSASAGGYVLVDLFAREDERGVWFEARYFGAAHRPYLLEGIDWRNPVRSWRPSRAG